MSQGVHGLPPLGRGVGRGSALCTETMIVSNSPWFTDDSHCLCSQVIFAVYNRWALMRCSPGPQKTTTSNGGRKTNFRCIYRKFGQPDHAPFFSGSLKLLCLTHVLRLCTNMSWFGRSIRTHTYIHAPAICMDKILSKYLLFCLSVYCDNLGLVHKVGEYIHTHA